MGSGGLNIEERAEAMKKLDAAERAFLATCGWVHNAPYGWVHRCFCPQPVSQWDAVLKARRRFLREQLLARGLK